ncbi:MAG: hypothetical protein ACLFRP_08425 [Puniceicoccaceae bacterium]
MEEKLSEAVEARDLAYAQDTLSAGADPEAARSRREGLLAEAFSQGDDEMIVLLARNGLTVDPATGDSAVNLVLRLGSRPALEEILAMGAEFDLSPIFSRKEDGCPQAVLDAFRTGDLEILALVERNGVAVFDPEHWGEQDFVLLTGLWGDFSVQNALRERGLRPAGNEWRSKAPLTWHFDQIRNSHWSSNPFAAKGHVEPTESHRQMWERLAAEEDIVNRLRNGIFRLNIHRQTNLGKGPEIVHIPDDADTLRIWIALGFDPATIPDYFPGQAVRAGCLEMVNLLGEHGIEAPFREIDPGGVGYWDSPERNRSSAEPADWNRVEELHRGGDWLVARGLSEYLWEPGTHDPKGAMLKALTTFGLLPSLVTSRTEEAREADKRQEFLDADPFDRPHRVYSDYTPAQMFADADEALRDVIRTMAAESADSAGWEQETALFYRQKLPYLMEQVTYPLAAIVALDRQEALRPAMDAYRERLDELWEQTTVFFRRDGGGIPERAWEARAANGALRARDEDDFLANVLLPYYEGDLGEPPEVADALRPRLLVAASSGMRAKNRLPSLGRDRLRYPGAWRDLQAHVRALDDDPWARVVDLYIDTAVWRRNADDRRVSLEARIAFLEWVSDVLGDQPPGAHAMIYGAAGSISSWLKDLPAPPMKPLQSVLQDRGLSIPREFLGEDIGYAVRWLYLTTGQPADGEFRMVASEIARLTNSRGGWRAFRAALFNRLNDPWYPKTKDKMEEWIRMADEQIAGFDESLAALRNTAEAPSESLVPVAGKLLHDPRRPSTWEGPDPRKVKGSVAMVPMGDGCVLRCRYSDERFRLTEHFYRHDFNEGTTKLIATMPEEMESNGAYEIGASNTHVFLWGPGSGLRVLGIESGEWAHPLRTADDPPPEISACSDSAGTIFVYVRTEDVPEKLEIHRYDPDPGRLSSLPRFDRSILGESLSKHHGFSLHIADDRYLFLATNSIVPASVFDLATGNWVPNEGASAELAEVAPGLGSSQPVTQRDLLRHRERLGLNSWNPEWKWDFKLDHADSPDPFLAKISFRKRHTREKPVELTFRLVDPAGGDLPVPAEGESYRILGFDLLPSGVFVRFSAPFLGIWISDDEIARLSRIAGLDP